MGLQVDRDAGFHRREQLVQAIGMLMVLAVVGAGLLGLVGGSGPLSTTTSRDATGLVDVQYQRFLHREADHSLTVTVDGQAVTGDGVDLEIAAAWIDTVDISGTSPPPAEHIRTDDGLILRLLAEPGSPVTVRIEYRVNDVGGLEGWARIHGAEVWFGQFVFP